MDTRILKPLGLTLVSSICLSACASLDSRPQPLRLERDAIENFKSCDYKVAKRLIASANGHLIQSGVTLCQGSKTTQEVRNAFITYAMDLIDTRYKGFIIGISRESKANNLGFNFISLALTAGATVAGESTANALSAGSTAIIGTRDSFNKDALYEQTIAALIDEMYAMRADARKPILTGLTLAADKYSIDTAARDIEAYDEAADLNRAFQRLVRSAAERAKTAKDNEEALKAELVACQPTPDLFVPRGKVVTFLNGLPDTAAGNTKLQEIAQSLNILILNKPRDEIKLAISRKIAQSFCSLSEFQTLVRQWDPNIL